jgi:hypothetical protein
MADKRISQLVDRGTVVNSDVVPIVVSGAVTTNKATISSIQTFMQGNLDLGVTSVGITLGSSGTDVNVTGSPVTSSGNITINIPSASATNRGLVTTGSQTFAGAKTFNSDIIVNGITVGKGGASNVNNTAVGTSALSANTTGSSNTATGLSALLVNTGGNANTANGYLSLQANTTGGSNASVGNQSLYSNTTGSNNTAVGNDSLYSNITGGKNTGIGAAAGYYIADGSTPNTTSDFSIYLGADTKASADNAQNEVVIGYNAIGNGSNTVTIGNSSITSNKLFGKVIHADAVNADESATLGQINTALAGYVTLGTAQTITAQKTFTTSGSSDTMIISHGSGSGFALDVIKAGSGEAIRVQKTSGSGNAMTISGGNFEAGTIVKTGGTSSQFLKADGSVDSSTYLTTGSAASIYLPLAGGTLTGALNGTSANFTGGVTINGLTFVNNTSDTTARLLLRNTTTGADAGGLDIREIGVDASINNASNGSLSLSTNNTTRLTLASTGAANFSTSASVGGLNLSATYASKLGLYNPSGSANMELGNAINTNGSIVSRLVSINANNGNTGNESSANFIGVASIETQLVSTSGNASGTSGANILFLTKADGGTLTERMRITSGGYLKASNTGNYLGLNDFYHEFNNNRLNFPSLLVNASSADFEDQALAIYASRNTTNNSFYAISYYNIGASNYKFRVADSGNVTNTNNSYGSLSDIKIKENIKDASPKLDDLMKVKVRNYNLIGEETKQIGVIAQELEEVFPAMIDESEDFEEVEVPQLDEEGNEVLNEEGEVLTTKEKVSKGTTTKSVKYSVFVPMLIKAIQEQQEQIDSLKNQIK